MFISSKTNQSLRHFMQVCYALTAVLFGLTTSCPLSYAQSYLPVPGKMIQTTTAYEPVLMRGLRIYPEHPLKFDFIINAGESELSDAAFRSESDKLIKYFLTALTIPEDQMWVNLSPYEGGRVVTAELGATAMGRDLLAQDYLLKQLTASLMYPEQQLGETFWKRIYERLYQEYGTTEIPVSTFNKVWIVPDRAVVYEKDGGAYVVDRHFKVMLEEDYQASIYAQGDTDFKNSIPKYSESNHITAQIVKEIIIPEIEKEVNSGRNFAKLRQIYNAMILATWYKQKLHYSLLGQVYVDQQKIKGIDLVNPQLVRERIYEQYMAAFRKGVYDFIKEDYDPGLQDDIPRRYFSGGLIYQGRIVQTKTDGALLSENEATNLVTRRNRDRLVTAMLYETSPDAAMVVNERPESDKDQLARIKSALYPQGEVQPVHIRATHEKVQNLVVLDTEHENFGHAATWVINGGASTTGHSLDLSTPTGNRKVTFDIVAPEGESANGFPFKVTLQDIVGTPRLKGEGLFAKPELLATPDRTVGGSEFIIRLENLEGLSSLLLSTLRFGSGKSIKDEKRSGPSDPTAAAYTKEYVDEGRDIRVQHWTKRGEPRFRAMAQPRTLDGLHDTHNYLAEMDFDQIGFRPGSVTVALTEDNDIIINKDADVDYVILRVRMYSDHSYLGHMPLEELFDAEILENYSALREEDQRWFGDKATGEQRNTYKKLIQQLRRQMLSRNSTRQHIQLMDVLRTQIEQLAEKMEQPAEFRQAALDPVARYEEIPFFTLARLESLLHNGQFLITHSAAILAGSPHYLTPFGGDVIIILRELLGYLRPDVVREQFYHLLRLVREGQLAHEVDIRFHGTGSRHVAKRFESPRRDTEILLMMFAATMLDHPEYNIDWNADLGNGQSVAQVVQSVASYVLSSTEQLTSPVQYTELLGPKKMFPDHDEPRLDWEDATSSKAYGKYSHLIQYLVPYALKAISKLQQQQIVSSQVRVTNTLIEDWTGTRGLFEAQISRAHRIDALMQWYEWRINRTENGRQFVVALLRDAMEYYGLDFELNDASNDDFLQSIRAFLEQHVPLGEFSYQAKVLDAQGNQIGVADTNPLIFATSTAEDVNMAEIRQGLELVFTHVAFGGVALLDGSVQTGIPTVMDAQRQVKFPLNVGVAIPSTDLYEIYHKNYHGMIIWLSMNYKRLNGLIRQINHRLNNGEGFSHDVQMMYVAVEVLYQEMNQLAELITEETLEPFVIGFGRFNWRPYGSDVNKGEDDGIQSGFMQGFNIMALPAINNLRRLRQQIDGLAGNGYLPSLSVRAAVLRQNISATPAAVRAQLRTWIAGGDIQRTVDATAQPGGDEALLNNITARKGTNKNVGGIDLNAEWMQLEIKRDDAGVPLPVNEQQLNNIQLNVEGFYPVIINVIPIDLPLHLGLVPESKTNPVSYRKENSPAERRERSSLSI